MIFLDIRPGKNRFGEDLDKGVAEKSCNTTSELGISGEERDEVYVEAIKGMEMGDEEGKMDKEAKTRQIK